MKKTMNPWVAVAVIVGVIVGAYFALQAFGGGSSDSFYDKSAENPKLPPGVAPGQAPPTTGQK